MPMLPKRLEFDDARFFAEVMPQLIRQSAPAEGTCRFVLEGTPRRWFVDLATGEVDARETEADATVTLAPAVLRQLVEGKLDGAAAVLGGALKIEGAPEVVLRVAQVLQTA